MLSKIIKIIPKQLVVFATTFLLCVFGLFLKGDWLIALSAFYARSKSTLRQEIFHIDPDMFKDLWSHILWSIGPTTIAYGSLCGFLHWNFYYRQRDQPQDWKCQPRTFLSWEDEKNEICLGISSLTFASGLSGILSCYIGNGGYTTLYSNISDHGWIYFLVSIPVCFLFTDFVLYWAHRTFHRPFFYKWIHKYHHRYKQPTPFSASALHPIEIVTYQSIILSPIFLAPIHWAALLTIISYDFYYGIMDHSGIKMEAIWPWQPNTTFHDNHHQYYHCNYGFNTCWVDRFFGTIRKKNRVYNENIFGFGKSMAEASSEEIGQHKYNIKDD